MLQSDFVLGATASCIAATFTNPWEVVKTRLQLQNELCRTTASTPRHYRTAVQTFLRIYHREGLLGLQRGLGAAYGYQILMNGTRLGCYPLLYHQGVVPLVFSGADGADGGGGKGSLFLASMLSGFVCGLLGAFVSSPLYLIKSRMQAYSTDPQVQRDHQRYGYRSVAHGIRTVAQQHGVGGLWKGVSGSMLRTGVGSTAQLSSYEALKKYYLDPTKKATENQFVAHLQASLVTGVIVTACMNPFDVVTTRLYNQQHPTSGTTTNTTPVYRGPVHALFKILQKEGVGGLYKGVTAHWFRVGPHNVLTFVFLEQLRYLVSMSSSSNSYDASLSDIP